MYTPVPSCQKVTQNWKIEKYNGLQDNETLLKVLFITWQKSAKLTKLAQLKGLNQTERKAANGNKTRVLVNTMQTGTRITNQSSFVMTTHVTSVTLPPPPLKEPSSGSHQKQKLRSSLLGKLGYLWYFTSSSSSIVFRCLAWWYWWLWLSAAGYLQSPRAFLQAWLFGVTGVSVLPI